MARHRTRPPDSAWVWPLAGAPRRATALPFAPYNFLKIPRREPHASTPVHRRCPLFRGGLVALGPRLLLQRRVHRALGAVDVAARVLLGGRRRARDAPRREPRRQAVARALVRPAAHPRARLPLRLRVARVAGAQLGGAPAVRLRGPLVRDAGAGGGVPLRRLPRQLRAEARRGRGSAAAASARAAAAPAAGAGCRAAGGSGGRRTAARSTSSDRPGASAGSSRTASPTARAAGRTAAATRPTSADPASWGGGRRRRR